MVLTDKFFELFQGLDRAYGFFTTGVPNPKKGGKLEGKASTVVGPVVPSLWAQHLSGQQGLGIIPIRDDATCLFGAIDIDIYDGLDLIELEKKISVLPLVLARTKSGGAHLYMFLEDALPAEYVRGKLIDWAIQLGFPGIEIYPKQSKLANTKDVGSWINMPYFNMHEGNRYAIKDGKALTAQEFITYAHEKKATKAQIDDAKIKTLDDGDFLDAPPCIQILASQGFPEGTRNNGLLNMGVYARLKFGEAWQDKLEEFNHLYMKPPLKMSEIKLLVKSLGKKDYFYTCGKTPLSQYCNKDICKTRPHGVGGNEDEPSINIGELVKINSVPPTWIIEVEGNRMELSTVDLLNQEKFRLLCMESINILPNRMKPIMYEKIIKDRLQNVRIVEAPPDSGPEGRFWGLVEQFCTGRAQAKTQDELLRGMPWTDNGLTYFRSRDLIKYLDQQHFRDFRERQIWAILRRDDKVIHGQFNIKGVCIQWWAVPEFQIQTEEFDIHKVIEDI